MPPIFTAIILVKVNETFIVIIVSNYILGRKQILYMPN